MYIYVDSRPREFNLEHGQIITLTQWVAADLEPAYEFCLQGAWLSATTLRPAPAGSLGPCSSAERAWVSGPHTAAEQNSRARDRLPWGVMSGRGRVGEKMKMTPVGGGDTTSLRQSWTHTHTRGQSHLFFLSLDRWLTGSLSCRQVGLPPRAGGLSSHRGRTRHSTEPPT